MIRIELKNRVAIISEENISRLAYLHGKMDIDDLSRVVNNHVTVAIDEIMEDEKMKNRVLHCDECAYAKCVDIIYKDYYCDNEDRINDMGKLGVDRLPKTSPEWCPKRESQNMV